MTCGEIETRLPWNLILKIRIFLPFERRGEKRKEYWKWRGKRVLSLGILGIYLSLFVFVSSFPTVVYFSSLSLFTANPSHPPFKLRPRPLTSLRSFLLCEYFPSSKKISEKTDILSLSL